MRRDTKGEGSFLDGEGKGEGVSGQGRRGGRGEGTTGIDEEERGGASGGIEPRCGPPPSGGDLDPRGVDLDGKRGKRYRSIPSEGDPLQPVPPGSIPRGSSTTHGPLARFGPLLLPFPSTNLGRGQRRKGGPVPAPSTPTLSHEPPPVSMGIRTPRCDVSRTPSDTWRMASRRCFPPFLPSKRKGTSHPSEANLRRADRQASPLPPPDGSTSARARATGGPSDQEIQRRSTSIRRRNRQGTVVHPSIRSIKQPWPRCGSSRSEATANCACTRR